MARIATIALAAAVTPMNDVGAYGVSVDYALAADLANTGDRITLYTFNRAGYLSLAEFAVDATIGAGSTLKLQHSNAADAVHTDLTGATTAGGADRERCTRGIRFAEGDTIDLLVGTADMAAAANVSLEMLLSHNPVINAAAY